MFPLGTRINNIEIVGLRKPTQLETDSLLSLNFQLVLIGSKIDKKIPFAPGNFKEYFNKKDINGNLFINPANSSFFLVPSVPKEVEEIIDNLNIKKSTGPNSVPVFILKIFKQFFSFWL